jgi:endonuclease YncB( thermonuclease family)
MLAWRKKPDGFEWHEYIRTAVRHRREARRERVHAARRAAGEQMNAAGAALVAGSRAAGSAARDGTIAGVGTLALTLQAAWSLFLIAVQRVLSLLAQAVAAAMRPILAALARPNIGGPVVLAGAIALGAGIGRSRGVGLDNEAIATLAIGAVLMAALVPMLAAVRNWRLPQFPAVATRAMGPVLGLAILAGGAAWFASGGGLGNIAGVANLPLIGGKALQGRAQAVGADTLRVGSTTLRLAGIDVPEPEQRCGRAGGRGCRASAEVALSRLVSGRSVSCSISGSDSLGRSLGQCTAGDKDVAAELVRQGHVFAEEGMLSRYASQEREAKAAKAGIWSGADVERPSAFRAKSWEEAKRRAPDGCPIKGQVAGGSRTYVLPWDSDYDRLRVQKTRGERWFCSEREAVSAGFKAAQRG